MLQTHRKRLLPVMSFILGFFLFFVPLTLINATFSAWIFGICSMIIGVIRVNYYKSSVEMWESTWLRLSDITHWALSILSLLFFSSLIILLILNYKIEFQAPIKLRKKNI